MFKARSPRPVKGWPSYDHLLDERLFPGKILSEGHLNYVLSECRITAIREALANPIGSDEGQDICISYKVPRKTLE